MVKPGAVRPVSEATRRTSRRKPGEQPVVLRARLAPYLANNLPFCRLAPLPGNRPVALPPRPSTTALPLSGLPLARRTSCPFAGLDSLCIAKIAHVCDLARFGRAKKTAPRLRPGETQDALIVLDSGAQLNHIHERFLRASSLYSTKRGRPLVETPCPVGQGALPSRRKRAKAAAMPSLSAPPGKPAKWANADWMRSGNICRAGAMPPVAPPGPMVDSRRCRESATSLSGWP